MSHQITSSLPTNDVIIVGAGVAGSALAHTLGKEGRNVLLIEKNLKESKIISGEVLQPAGYLKLRELGLDDCLKEIDAKKLLGYEMHKDGRSTVLQYPLDSYHNDVAGRSFHHGRFVQKLREKAASLLTVKVEEGTAESLIEWEGHVKGVKYTNSLGQEKTAYAPLTILCNGRFSKLCELLGKPEIDKPSLFGGLILETDRTQTTSFAHVILANPSIMMFYPLSDTEIRCLIDFPGSKLPFTSKEQMAHFLKSEMAPQVPTELRDAFLSSVEKCHNLKAMPVSCMPANPHITPGAILLGDALNMRHAITGGGMTVALHDVALLSNLLRPLDFKDTAKVTVISANFYNTRKPAAFTINIMADALYKVIYGTTDKLRDQILRANFNYMSLDFGFKRTLVGLISGLNCNPWNIVFHFFALAIYITCHLTLPIPSPTRVYQAARYLLGALAVAVPLIWKEGLRQVFFAAKDL